MANPNIDDKFKAFFEERALAPKENAWDRLESLMPVNEPVVKKDRRPIFWSAVAATFAGFIMALFMWNLNDVNSTLSVATTNEVILKEEQKPTLNMEPSKPSYENQEVKNEVIAAIENKVVSTKNINSKPDQVKPVLEPINTEVISQNPVVETKNEIANIDEKPVLKTEEISKINIDANLLLQEVNSKLELKKTNATYASSSVRPDPSKLLQDAESANERTTMQRIFKSLQSNSENVIAAVSNRNYKR